MQLTARWDIHLPACAPAPKLAPTSLRPLPSRGARPARQHAAGCAARRCAARRGAARARGLQQLTLHLGRVAWRAQRRGRAAARGRAAPAVLCGISADVSHGGAAWWRWGAQGRPDSMPSACGRGRKCLCAAVGAWRGYHALAAVQRPPGAAGLTPRGFRGADCGAPAPRATSRLEATRHAASVCVADPPAAARSVHALRTLLPALLRLQEGHLEECPALQAHSAGLAEGDGAGGDGPHVQAGQEGHDTLADRRGAA